MKRTLILGLIAALTCLLIATPAILAGGEPLETKSVCAYFSPDGGAEQAIVKEIRGAKKTLEVAVYLITNHDIADAIINRAQNGVEVRVIHDKEQAKQRYSKARDLAKEETKVLLHRWVPAPPGEDDERGEEPKMHHKFAIVDSKSVITGSFNFTRGAETRNCENVVILRDRRVAAAFKREFDRMWKLASGDE